MLKFDQERNLIVMDEEKKEQKTVDANKEQNEKEEFPDDSLEEDKKPYGEAVSTEEFSLFKSRIEDLVRKKAQGLGVSEQAIMDLADLDFASLEAPIETEAEALIKQKAQELGVSEEAAKEQLDSVGLESLQSPRFHYMKLNNGNLELLEESMREAVDGIYRNRQGKIVEEHRIVDAAMEFVNKHKKFLNLGALALYLSTFGSSALKSLSGDDAKIIIDTDDIKEDGRSLTNSTIAPYDASIDDMLAAGTTREVESIKDNYLDLEKTNQTLDTFEKFEPDKDAKDGSIGYINTKYLMNDSTLISLIDGARDENSPIDILRHLSDTGEFVEGEARFSLSVEKGIVRIKDISKYTFKSEQDFEKCDKLISNLRGSGYPLESFIANEEEIVNAIAEGLNVSEDDVRSYTDKVLMPDTSKISVVKFQDFNVPKDEDTPEMIKLKSAKEEIYKKHGLNFFGQLIIDEPLQKQIDNIATNGAGLADMHTEEARDKFIKANEESNLLEAENELNDWLERNGYEADYDTIMNQVIQHTENYEIKEKLRNSGIEEIDYKAFENSEEFKSIFIKALEKEGYPLPVLDAIAKQDPKKVVEIVSKVVDKMVGYDHHEANHIKARNALIREKKEVSRNDIEQNKIDRKHASRPAATLRTHAGVCDDFAITTGAGLGVLKEVGLSNMDNYDVVATEYAGYHKYIMLVTYEEDKVRLSMVDPTFANDDRDKVDGFDEADFDGIDYHHYFHGVSKETYENYKENLKEQKMQQHEELLKRIEMHNSFVLQQEIIDMMTRYDPEAIRRRRIFLDKESYSAVKQKETQDAIEIIRKNIQNG